MIKTILIITALFFTACVNKHGLSAKYYSECKEYYALQGYYHNECGEDDVVTYKKMGEETSKLVTKAKNYIYDEKEHPKAND